MGNELVGLVICDLRRRFRAKTTTGGGGNFLQPILAHANDGNLWQTGLQTFPDIANLVINGGGDGNLTRDFLVAALKQQINAFLASGNLLFNHATEAKCFRRLFDPPLHRLVLFAALAKISRRTRRFLFHNRCRF